MADIVTVHSDKVLTLINEEFMQQFTQPSTWETLRFGALLTSNLTADEASSQFAMGFCSGTTNGIGHATSVTHFVGTSLIKGVDLRTNGTVDWSSNAFYNVWMQNPHDIRIGKVVGTTVTNGSSPVDGIGSSFAGLTGESGSGVNKSVLLDITKGSPNWTIKLWVNYVTNTVSESDFSTHMLEATPDTGIYKSYSVELAVDEATDGTLNAVNLFWTPVGTGTAKRLEIHKIEVAQLA